MPAIKCKRSDYCKGVLGTQRGHKQRLSEGQSPVEMKERKTKRKKERNATTWWLDVMEKWTGQTGPMYNSVINSSIFLKNIFMRFSYTIWN